jgi:hypothetical protein
MSVRVSVIGYRGLENWIGPDGRPYRRKVALIKRVREEVVCLS